MLRALGAAVVAAAVMTSAACHSASYAVRPIPRIAADSVGKPVSRLKEAFGPPRKIDTTPTKELYVWFLAQAPAGAPAGFHGCEMEVTVDPRSEHVLGYSLSNIGWAQCRDVERKIRITER
ncbi:MAG TPA: hypothetical protein VK437_11540 [Steroidobacteraceae bacterium]|nr:hypothetical protein [Steroidobacteraceae bacterium]